MIDFEDLAIKKEEESNIPKEDWLKILESAKRNMKFNGLGLKEIEELAISSADTSRLNYMLRLFYEACKNNINETTAYEELSESIQNSSFSLTDWIDSFYCISEWCSKRNLKIGFRSMLSYIICASESSDSRSLSINLSSLVLEMLEEHGIDDNS
jgi:hypothetical protein